MPQKTKLHIWRKIRVSLPEDWELLQFSKNSALGRIAFADRYRFRAELSWKTVEGKPDFDRMISDYKSKLRDEGELTALNSIRRVGWAGLEGRRGKILELRFGKYFKEESLLIEVVLIWPNAQDIRMEKDILNSISIEPRREDRFTRWKAFGMDFLVRPRLKLVKANVRPADVTLKFAEDEIKNTGHEQEFRRMGFVDTWLRKYDDENKRLLKWLESEMPEQAFDAKHTVDKRDGHIIEQMQAMVRLSSMARWLGHKRQYLSRAFICPVDERLYSSKELWTPSDLTEELPVEELTLRCDSDECKL